MADFYELLGVARVVTQVGMVEAKFHIAGKRNRSPLKDFLLDNLPQSHKPFRWRSMRSCGVRMNISTR